MHRIKISKLTILAVREEDNLIALDNYDFPEIELLNFPITKNKDQFKNNFFALLHSLAATPARYVEAATQKASAVLHSAFFLLNPLIELDGLQWINLLNKLKELDPHQCTYISSADDFPIGLLVPQRLQATLNESLVLRFLSWVSASLDVLVLETLIQSVHLIFTCINLQLSMTTEFLTNARNLSILKLMASHYLQASMNPQARPKDYIAVIPYHAGDVLFFCIALKESRHPFTAIAVNACYVDIVTRVLPNIKVYKIDVDPIYRGQNKDHESAEHQNDEYFYFLDTVYPKLQKQVAFYYFRPNRDLDVVKFHFIDQWKFSLSNDSFDLISDTIFSQNSIYEMSINKSILIQFDAGWHLKIYPDQYQRKLVELLKKSGYRITILSDKPKSLAVDEYISFSDLAALEHKVRSHSIFLGMDSFPSHFAYHVVNHPTITLFSSTEPGNASVTSNLTYMALENGLTCRPCRSKDICPVFKTDYCHNFVAPEDLFNSIEKLYQRLYQAGDTT